MSEARDKGEETAKKEQGEQRNERGEQRGQSRANEEKVALLKEKYPLEAVAFLQPGTAEAANFPCSQLP